MPSLAFAKTKTRRHVAVCVAIPDVADLAARLKPFEDVFDEIVVSSFSPIPGGKSRYTPDDHRRLVESCHAMAMSAVDCYGWRYTPECQAVLAAPAEIRRCIAHMVERCETSGSDGLVVDFEAWPPHTRFAFTDFIAQLSPELHRRGKTLSVAAYPANTAQRRERGQPFIDVHSIAPLADRFHVMTYDQFCPPSPYIGPTSTTPWARDGMQDMLTQAPGYKLLMGLPTYSVDWDVTDPTRSRQVNDAAHLEACETISPIGRGWCYYWDVGLIRYVDSDQHIHLIYVSDARSTRSQLQNVDQLDLAGIFFWVFNGREDPEIYRAVRSHFAR
jgi:spore germination protein YaaH